MVGVSKIKTKKVKNVITASDELSIAIPEDEEEITLEEITPQIEGTFTGLKIQEDGEIVSMVGLVKKDGFIVPDTTAGKIKVYPPKTRIWGIIKMPN